ncbi:MAG: hypothetical protein MUC52_00965 [Candidatus Omnitrophica bacterium]|jgi:translation initiation factor 1|nr:hypothetical protein [Candidatus Omnitrophota bacterium]
MDKGIVYSTGIGKVCPECGRPAAQCACARIKKDAPPKDCTALSIRYETKGRKGKGVTVIKGLALSVNELEELAGKFKRRFGTGGSVVQYTIELQGDLRSQVKEELAKIGFKPG